jgi:hypothetical protein
MIRKREDRRREAEERAEARAKRTPAQQIAKILAAGYNPECKEVKRLRAQIEQEGGDGQIRD